VAISATTSSSPIDFSQLGLFGVQPNSPDALQQQLEATDALVAENNLSEDEKQRLQAFIKAHQKEIGSDHIDTPEELKKLLQLLHSREGRKAGLPQLDGKPGQNLNTLSNQEMLQLLADYFANFQQDNGQQQARMHPSFGGGVPQGQSSGQAVQQALSANTGAPTSTASLKGNTNAQKAFNYFVSKGLSPAQAAGIVGNLMAESGCDPTRSQDGGGPGRGIAQWSVGERWNGVLQLAAQEGKSPNDLGVQLDYMWKEMNSTESGSLQAIKGASSAADAAVAFEQSFERAGIPNNGARISFANDALRQFGGGVA
jgi:hypothetical protein